MVRLGYACINTVLRAQEVYTNRTLRLAKIKEQGVEVAKELGLKNIKDLIPIIKLNEKNGIRFFRLSSCIFPFASEPEYGYSLDYAAKELKEAGDLAKQYGHRLTTHPGQYNVLCSPSESVVSRTFKDLAYHAQMLDLMGLGSEAVMIIHMGGAYGDKEKSIKRFEENFLKLPEHIRNRLVLENDEVSYKVEELLPVCKKLKIPLVLDWHHDRLNPSSKPIQEYLPEIDAIWKERGIKPKQHYSESAKGHPNPRTHSDYISKLPPCAPDMDLMIEAKMKDQTVLRICKKYGISPDTNEYPTNEPQPLPDDDELENNNVTLKGHARKKHDWKKSTKKNEGEEPDDDGREKPEKKKRQRKPKAEKEGTTEAKKSTKVAKKTKGDAVETKKKRKKAADSDGDDEDFVEKKKVPRTRKSKKSKNADAEDSKSENVDAEDSKKSDAVENPTNLELADEVAKPKVSRKRKAVKEAEKENEKENGNGSDIVIEIEAVKEEKKNVEEKKKKKVEEKKSPKKGLRRSPRTSIIAQE